MSLIDLKDRITDDWILYNKQKKSFKSKIFVSNGIKLDNDSYKTLNLTVGDSYWKNGVEIAIPKNGIKLKSNESILISSKQKIALPYNVFGVITGVGTNIFKQQFISAGKIDCGYNGNLKVALYNGNKGVVTFKSDDLLAGCNFFTTDLTLNESISDFKDRIPLPEYSESKLIMLKNWIINNIFAIVSIIIACLTLILK